MTIIKFINKILSNGVKCYKFTKLTLFARTNSICYLGSRKKWKEGREAIFYDRGHGLRIHLKDGHVSVVPRYYIILAVARGSARVLVGL